MFDMFRQEYPYKLLAFLQKKNQKLYSLFLSLKFSETCDVLDVPEEEQ